MGDRIRRKLFPGFLCVACGIRQNAEPASLLPDASRQPPGIHALQSRNSEPGHIVRQRFLAPEIGRERIVLPHNQSARRRAKGLGILPIDPVISDERIGHDNCLIRIGRIRYDFFVSYHGSVEYHLADFLASRPEAISAELAPVLQNQFSVVCSCHTVLPPVTVLMHLPNTRLPAKGVLFPFEMKSEGSITYGVPISNTV